MSKIVSKSRAKREPNESQTRAKREQNESKMRAKCEQNASKMRAKREQNESKTRAKREQNESKTRCNIANASWVSRFGMFEAIYTSSQHTPDTVFEEYPMANSYAFGEFAPRRLTSLTTA